MDRDDDSRRGTGTTDSNRQCWWAPGQFVCVQFNAIDTD